MWPRPSHIWLNGQDWHLWTGVNLDPRGSAVVQNQNWDRFLLLHYTRLTALFPGLPRWAATRKVKPIWILLKRETVSGSGISWAVCKSAPRSRLITTPAPHHSDFYGPDALSAAQPTASKHWRIGSNSMAIHCCMLVCAAPDAGKADAGSSESVHCRLLLWSCDTQCTTGETSILYACLDILSLLLLLLQNWVVGCWRGYLTGAMCRFAYGPADATATHCLLLQ